MDARDMASKPMTCADCKALPEGERVERIDGVLYAQAYTTRAHASLTGGIYARLWNHLQGKPCEVYENLALRFEESEKTLNALCPDIQVVCDPSMNRDDGIVGTPTLIVEVMSPSTRKNDMTTKLRKYESNGVPECWLVYQECEVITQCVLVDGSYRMDYIGEGTIASTSIEGFSIDIQELYAAVDAK